MANIDVNNIYPSRPAAPAGPPPGLAGGPPSGGTLQGIKNMWNKLPTWGKILVVVGALVLIYLIWTFIGSGSGSTTAGASTPSPSSGGGGPGPGSGGGPPPLQTHPYQPIPPYPGATDSPPPVPGNEPIPYTPPTTSPTTTIHHTSSLAIPTTSPYQPVLSSPAYAHTTTATQTPGRGTGTSGMPSIGSSRGAINPNVTNNRIPAGHSAQNVNPNLAPQVRQQTSVGVQRSQPVVSSNQIQYTAAQLAEQAKSQASLWSYNAPSTAAKVGPYVSTGATNTYGGGVAAHPKANPTTAQRNAAVTQGAGGSQNVTKTAYVQKVSNAAQAKKGAPVQARALRG